MSLQVTYKNKKIEKVCTDLSEAEKRHGLQIACNLHQCIDLIRAADSVEMLVQHHIKDCHQLKGDRKQQYAMSLTGNWRLIFEKEKDQIHVVKIIEIEDYH